MVTCLPDRVREFTEWNTNRHNGIESADANTQMLQLMEIWGASDHLQRGCKPFLDEDDTEPRTYTRAEAATKCRLIMLHCLSNLFRRVILAIGARLVLQAVARLPLQYS